MAEGGRVGTRWGGWAACCSGYHRRRSACPGRGGSLRKSWAERAVRAVLIIFLMASLRKCTFSALSWWSSSLAFLSDYEMMKKGEFRDGI